MSTSLFGSVTVLPGLGSFTADGEVAVDAPSRPGAVVGDEWRRWVAENVLRGQAPASMIKAMVDRGIDPDVAAREIEAAQTHPYLRAAAAALAANAAKALSTQNGGFPATGAPATRLAKREWLLEAMRRAAHQDPATAFVPAVRRPSREQFLHEFYGAQRPCVIEGAMDDWPAMAGWTMENLKARFGDRRIEVQAALQTDADDEINSDGRREEMNFGEYIDRVTTAGGNNDFYLTANNSGRNRQHLKELWNDILFFPEYLRDDDPNNQGSFGFEPAGAVTPLRHDLTNNLMAQVVGRKLVRLISPLDTPYVYNHRHCYSQVDLKNIDYDRFPLFRNVRVIDVILNPGQVLFLPVGWWYHVTEMDISITMTFTNFVFDNDFYSGYTTYGEIG